MNPRTLRLAAAVYVVKLLLAGIAWISFPEGTRQAVEAAEAMVRDLFVAQSTTTSVPTSRAAASPDSTQQ